MSVRVSVLLKKMITKMDMHACEGRFVCHYGGQVIDLRIYGGGRGRCCNRPTDRPAAMRPRMNKNYRTSERARRTMLRDFYSLVCDVMPHVWLIDRINLVYDYFHKCLWMDSIAERQRVPLRLKPTYLLVLLVLLLLFFHLLNGTKPKMLHDNTKQNAFG